MAGRASGGGPTYIGTSASTVDVTSATTRTMKCATRCTLTEAGALRVRSGRTAVTVRSFALLIRGTAHVQAPEARPTRIAHGGADRPCAGLCTARKFNHCECRHRHPGQCLFRQRDLEFRELRGADHRDRSAESRPIGHRIALTAVSVSISVDAALIATGVNVGVVSAALDENDGIAPPSNPLRNIGFLDNTGTPNGFAGISAVTVPVGAATLKIEATNATVENTGVEGTQTATNMTIITVPFYVTAKADGTAVTIYTAVTNGAPSQSGPDDTRTGTPLVGNLVVPIPLTGHKYDPDSPAGTGTNVAGDTIWRAIAAGTVSFSEGDATEPTDGTLTGTGVTSPTVASQDLSPLNIITQINNLMTVSFKCWDGTALAAVPPATLSTFVDEELTPPGFPVVIDSVTVTEPSSTTSTTVCGIGTTTGDYHDGTTFLRADHHDHGGDDDDHDAVRPPAKAEPPGQVRGEAAAQADGDDVDQQPRGAQQRAPRALLFGFGLFLVAFSFFGVRRIPRRV